MNNILISGEAKLFILILIAFLYVFRTRVLSQTGKKLAYMFAFAGVLLSITADILPSAVICAVCSVSYALAVFFLLEWKFGIKFPVAIVFGALDFYGLIKGLNTPAYTMAMLIIISFSVEQYNKIRIDNLTKLYNRYGMDMELKEQLRQYKREHSDSFYIIACDLDKFKQINDTWGHLEGDRALVLIANALARVGQRFNSNVFRIGGDEFVIITDKSDVGLAGEITTAVKKELDNIDFRDDFNIEMSIGVALYDGKTSIADLLDSADKRLYEAKRN